MPIYEYECSKGHHYERAEGFDAPSVQTCPTCKRRSRRVISLPAVIFKGSGFYSTDNRKGWVSGNGDSGSDTSSGNGDKPAETSTAEATAAE